MGLTTVQSTTAMRRSLVSLIRRSVLPWGLWWACSMEVGSVYPRVTLRTCNGACGKWSASIKRLPAPLQPVFNYQEDAPTSQVSDALWHKACYGINARLLSPLPSSLLIIPRLIVLILAVTRGLKPVAQQSYLHIGKICLSLPCLHCKIRQALIP